MSAAADSAPSGDVAGQAAQTAGTPGTQAVTDGFDKVGDEAGLSRGQRGPAGPTSPTAPGAPKAPGPAAPGAPPAGQPPAQQPPALRDGQWLHDPRQTTPDQARELQQMLDRGGLHPDTEKAIRGFLDDYRNNRDSLFPDHPNPLPRSYPTNPGAPRVI